MKRFLAAVLTAGAIGLVALSPAHAQGGCGPYAHRGWDGFCHPGGWEPRPWGWGHGWHRPWGWHRHW